MEVTQETSVMQFIIDELGHAVQSIKDISFEKVLGTDISLFDVCLSLFVICTIIVFLTGIEEDED